MPRLDMNVPTALIILGALTPADVPPQLGPGEKITNPALYLASIRDGLERGQPAALHRLTRLLDCGVGGAARRGPHATPDTTNR